MCFDEVLVTVGLELVDRREKQKKKIKKKYNLPVPHVMYVYFLVVLLVHIYIVG